MPHDHHQRGLQVLYGVFHAAQGEITDEVARVTDDEQLSDARVEDVFRRHPGVAAADDDRQGRLAVLGRALPQLLAQHGRVGGDGLVAAVALHEPVQMPQGGLVEDGLFPGHRLCAEGEDGFQFLFHREPPCLGLKIPLL